MNRILKQVGSVVAFLRLVFLGDRLGAVGLNWLVLNSEIRYSRLYRGDMQQDILVIGDSRGVNAVYAPAASETLGLRVMNLSHNGVGMELAEVLLLDYLERNEKPRMVLFEISNLSQAMADETVKNQRMYYSRSHRMAALGQKYDALGYCTTRVAKLYAFNNELFLRALYYMNRTDQDWISRYTVLPSLIEKVKAMKAQVLPLPSKKNLVALQRILVELERRDIEYRLFLAPYLPEYLGKIHNKSEWLETIQKTVGPNLKVWDYSGVIRATKAFADRIHFNAYGAELLLEHMVNDKFFPDIRS